MGRDKSLVFDAPSIQDVQLVREWRNADISFLRTPFMLTEQMQKDFYHNVISNWNSDCRFWAIKTSRPSDLVAFGGLTGIQWENRLAEISLIVNPDERGKNYGALSVQGLLDTGFNELNLQNICGECYLCNPAEGFWEKMIVRFGGTKTTLPNRKYWDGEYWDSLYFNFEKSDYHGGAG